MVGKEIIFDTMDAIQEKINNFKNDTSFISKIRFGQFEVNPKMEETKSKIKIKTNIFQYDFYCY